MAYKFEEITLDELLKELVKEKYVLTKSMLFNMKNKGIFHSLTRSKTVIVDKFIAKPRIKASMDIRNERGLSWSDTGLLFIKIDGKDTKSISHPKNTIYKISAYDLKIIEYYNDSKTENDVTKKIILDLKKI